ncbi:MAG: D-aminoacyl-tRNA deacylase [Bacilli bacterium]
MKVVIQRVKEASVKVDKKIVGEIEKGLLILVGFTEGDGKEQIDWMVNKITNLRIFDDENGVMNLSVKDIEGSILSVSQFTLYADSRKGKRPSYINALKGESAIKLYELFNEKLRSTNITIEEGIFGEEMEVSLVNDGPVTIILEK